MNKLLADTRLVAALIALALICLTVLAVTHVIPGADAYKVLAGLITGVLITWQRGSIAPVAVEKTTTTIEEKKETPIPPVLPLLMLALLFLPAATCAQAKTIARGANDIAAELCAKYYSQKQGISVDDALKTVCAGEEVLAPWLRLVLSAEKSGVGKSGVVMCEQPPAQSVADGGHD